MSRSKRIASAAGAAACGHTAIVRPQAVNARARRLILMRGMVERGRLGVAKRRWVCELLLC